MKIVKWIILFVVSVGIGTFVDVRILENMDINIWLSRGMGCLVTVIIALIIYSFFFREKAKK